jgi:hypothetical protein
MGAAGRFVRDVLRSLTWRKVLLSQVLYLFLDVLGAAFVTPSSPSSFVWSRMVIGELQALSILLAIVIAEQAVVRGARPLRAYVLAILAASVFAGSAQFQIRHWLGIYTNVDQPGRPMSVRRTQMVVAGCITASYGLLVVLIYLDYQRRERLLRRLRTVQVERARREQSLAESRIARLRSDVDADELMTKLGALQGRFERGDPEAEGELDALIAGLRAKLAPADVKLGEVARA